MHTKQSVALKKALSEHPGAELFSVAFDLAIILGEEGNAPGTS